MSELTSSRYVIVDMDGTIADCSHRLHFIKGKDRKDKDWPAFEKACSEDPPIWPIINLVRMLHSFGFEILIVTGRHHYAYGQTVRWLNQYSVPFSDIFMRSDRDFRPDYEVKQQILNKLPKDQIAYVFEDRNSVVEMWRRNGLTCLQVNDGDF